VPRKKGKVEGWTGGASGSGSKHKRKRNPLFKESRKPAKKEGARREMTGGKKDKGAVVRPP